jgi:hypothetical protein
MHMWLKTGSGNIGALLSCLNNNTNYIELRITYPKANNLHC